MFRIKNLVILLSLFTFTACSGGGGGGGGDNRTDLEKGKAAVTVVRAWSTQVQDFSTQAEDNEIKRDQEVVAKNVDVAAGSVLQSLGFSLSAVVRAYNLNQGAAGEYGLIDYMDPEDLLQLVCYSPGNDTSDVTGAIVITESTASITGATICGDTVNVEYAIPQFTSGTTFEAAIRSASASNNLAFATINEGTGKVVYDTEVSLFDDPSTYPTPLSVDFTLEATFGQQKTELENAAQFTGRVEASLVRAPLQGQEEMNPKHLVLGGTFSDEAGTTLVASVEINLTNADTFYNDGVTDETVSNYADFDFKLSFSAELEGLPQASFVLEGDRTGLETGAGKISVSYDNVSFVLEGENFADQSYQISMTLTVVDDIGTTKLVIARDENSETSRGVITVNDTKVATIDQQLGDGGLIVNYTDDTFESLAF